MSDVDEEEFMCNDDEEYDLVNCTLTLAYSFLSAMCETVNRCSGVCAGGARVKR